MKKKVLSCLMLIVFFVFLVVPFSDALSLENTAITTRLSGRDRYETAVAISKHGWQEAHTVVIARGDDYADALSGVPLAHALGAPILLTDKNNLSSVVKNEINRLQASNVYLLGGNGALSPEIEREIKAMGINVSRISGENRFATAAEVARELASIKPFSRAVMVYGMNFPDALAAAPYAAMNGLPILLVNKTTLPDATMAAIQDLGLSEFFIVGGTGVINETAVSMLPSKTRIYGTNRFGTALELAKYFKPGSEKLYIATGLGFADAITGAVLAAKTGQGMLLVQPNRIQESV